MNILVVCHYGLYQDLTSSFVHNQLRALADLGHNVRVIIPNGLGKNGRDGERFGPSLVISRHNGVTLCDLRYVTLSQYGKKYFNAASAIAAVRLHRHEIFKDFKPDVIHAHTLGFDSEIGAWLKKMTGCPLVVTTHGSDTAVPVANGEGAMLCHTADKADCVVAVSNQLADLVRSCGTKTRVVTIHNGFIVHPCAEAVDADPYSMIQVGHLIPSKRTEVTIRAVAQLKEKYPKIHLTVIGEGYLRHQLEQLCRELRIEQSVAFTGQLPNVQVAQALRKAAYFVMASKPEGFGIVYLEAMAAGCVTVGTQGQGIADIIEHGKNGFLVPSDDVDAIVKVIDDCICNNALRQSVADQGQKAALEMDWSRNAEIYTKLFQSFLT